MDSFVQKVFNQISLEKDPDLWQSRDDGLTEKRLQFLSGFKETLFQPQLQRSKRSTLSKNSKLSVAFLAKATQLMSTDLEKTIVLLNNALTLAEDQEKVHKILHLRLKALFEMKEYNLVLEGYHTLHDLCNQEDVDCREMTVFIFKSRLNLYGDVVTGGDIAKVSMLNKANDLLKAKNYAEVEKLDLMLDSLIKVKVNQGLCLLDKNEDYPNFSASLKVKRTGHQGRFVVAKKDLEPGELIALDEPSVTYLDNKYSKTNCWHCLKGCRLTALPCSGCSGVVFCCKGCKEKAEGSYHLYECGQTDILSQADIEVWILALRIICSNPLKMFLEFGIKDKDTGLYSTTDLETHTGLH